MNEINDACFEGVVVCYLLTLLECWRVSSKGFKCVSFVEGCDNWGEEVMKSFHPLIGT